MRVEIVGRIGEIDARRWDALVGEDDPFVEHAFLSALEESGSVGPGTGWRPCHVLVRDGDRLVGAAPLYLKSDSFGEYIFDWGWAQAAERAGLRYYPKLVSAVPFTPAGARRLLVEGGAARGAVVDALVAGMRRLADEVGASSIHLLFVSPAERDALVEEHGFLPRLSYQFHFRDEGYGTFDGFLAALRSAPRKQIRRERQRVAEAGLTFRTVSGAELTDAELAALRAFYVDTIRRKRGRPYLTAAFFDALRAGLGHRAWVALAERDGAPIAAALGFHKGAGLYGRYWGCREPVAALHFELCCYRLIELGLARGCRHVEAGAQGEHKLKRGFLPAPTLSVHWIRDPALGAALARHLPLEGAAIRAEMAALTAHGPFRVG